MKKKKSILFINNIFESAGCGALEKVAKLLHVYERIVLQPQAINSVLYGLQEQPLDTLLRDCANEKLTNTPTRNRVGF